MSVAEQIGLEDESGGLLAQGAHLWAAWVREAPQLGVVACLADLRPWLRAAEPARADQVLHELARLGAATASRRPGCWHGPCCRVRARWLGG